jgi:competence/damage-inducible protein CinA-like protein
MKVEIITTGDEVMQGVIVDTNTAWIAERLSRLGHEIVRHESVSDDEVAIRDVLIAAASRADAVVVTGGLGPTTDDLTLSSAADAFGVKLVKNEAVLHGIEEFFKCFGRQMSVSNEKQAYVPQGGDILPNSVGTAPGIGVDYSGTRFFFLPGVPKELYQIFSDSVEPWFAKRAEGAYSERVLRCFGSPEATIDTALRDVDLSDVRLSFRVKFPDVLVKLTARAETLSEADKTVAAAADLVRNRLGDIVYGEGDDCLAKVVGAMLHERGMTLSVAESCTGGLISNLITDIPGSSEYFNMGAVTYSNRSKQDILGISGDLLAEHGAVSDATVRAMAEGVRRIGCSSVGIAVTGVAGPGGGSSEKPVGTVFIGISTEDGCDAKKYVFNRDRIWFKQFVAATALDSVRRLLIL